jgi:hypothetical protein
LIFRSCSCKLAEKRYGGEEKVWSGHVTWQAVFTVCAYKFEKNVWGKESYVEQCKERREWECGRKQGSGNN